MRKKDVLISLLAASVPMSALADATVTDLISFKDGAWTSEDDGLSIDATKKLLISPAGDAISQTLKTLTQGKYKLTIGATDFLKTLKVNGVALTDADGKALADGATQGFYNFELPATGDFEIVFTPAEADSFSVAIEALDLVFDFATAKASLEQKLATVILKINGLDDTDKDKASLSAEASAIAAKIAELGDEATQYQAYTSYALYNEENVLTDEIAALDLKFEGLKDNSAAYFAALTIVNAWNLDDVTLPTDTKAYKYAELKAAYDAIAKTIADYKTGLDAAYKEGTAGVYTAEISDTQDEIDAAKKTLKENIAAYAVYDTNYNNLTTILENWKTNYNSQLQLVIKALVPGEIYSDWSTLALQALSNEYVVYSEINGNVSPEEHNVSTEDYTKYEASLAAAKHNVDSIADRYITKANALNAAHTADTTSVNDLNAERDALVKAIEPEASLFTKDVEAIDALIAALEKEINAEYAKHTEGTDYTSDVAAIEKAIADLETKADPFLDNYNAFKAVEKKIADLNKKLTEANTKVNALEDSTYLAKGKYAATEATLAGRISEQSEALNAAYAKKDKPAENAVAKQSAIEAELTAIGTAIESHVTRAEGALVNYQAFIAAVETYDTNWEALNKKVGSRGDVEVLNAEAAALAAKTTYGENLKFYQDSIANIRIAYDSAFAASDSAHVDSMASLVANTLNSAINDVLAKLTASFDADQTTYDAEALEKAVAALHAQVEASAVAAKATIAADSKDWATSTGLAYTDIKKTMDDILAEIDAIVTESANKAGTPNAEALAYLTTANTELSTLMSEDWADLKEVAAEAIAHVKANKEQYEAAKKASEASIDALGEINVKVWLDTDSTSMFNTEISELNDTHTTLSSDYTASYNAETIVKDWAYVMDKDGKNVVTKGFGTRFAELDAAIAALHEKALATAVNYTNYTLVVDTVAGADFATLVADAEAAVAAEAAGASEYYTKLVDSYETAATKVTTDNFDLYDEGKCTEVTANSFTAVVTKLIGDLEAVEGLIKANNENYKLQTDTLEFSQDYWSATYASISANDKSSARDSFLVVLSGMQVSLNELGTEIEAAYAEGQSAEKHAGFIARFDSFNAAIKALADAQQEGYNALIAADNLARHERFLAAATAANNAYAEAVQTLNAFNAIKSADLKASVDDLMNTHQEIYAFSTVISQLKSDEWTAYEKVASPEVFDAEESFLAQAIANKDAINAKLSVFTDAVNNAAVTHHDAAKTGIDAALTNYVNNLVDYSEDVKEAAFADVRQLKKELDGLKLAGNLDYAVELDKLLQRYADLTAMLDAGKEPAATAEWDVMITYADSLKTAQADSIAKLNWQTTSDKDYNELYADELAGNYHNADSIAKANVGKLYAKMPTLKRLMNKFETNANKIFNEAVSMSAGHETNIKRYAELTDSLALANNEWAAAFQYVDAYCLVDEAGIATSLNDTKSSLDEYAVYFLNRKNTGYYTDEGWFKMDSSYIEGWRTDIKDIYPLANYQEQLKLQALILGDLKADYNQAVAEAVKANDNDATLKKVEVYNALIAAESDSVMNIDLTKADVQAEFLAMETRLAQYRYELSQFYNASLSANIAATLTASIDAADAEYAQALADARKYDAVYEAYAASFAAWAGEIQGARDFLAACLADNSIIFYEDKITAMVEAIRDSDKDDLVNAVKALYKKYADNDKYYEVLMAECDELEASLAAAKAEVEVYAYAIKYPVDSISYYKKAVKYLNDEKEQLNNLYENVDIDENTSLSWRNNIEMEIVKLRGRYTREEYQAIARNMNNAISDLHYRVGTSAYGMFLQVAKDTVAAIYDELYSVDISSRGGLGAVNHLFVYLTDAARNIMSGQVINPVYYDINGVQISDTVVVDGVEEVRNYRNVDFFEELSAIKERAEYLQSRLEAAYAAAEAGRYVKGDAAYVEEDGKHVRDNFVTVEDYEQVLNIVLEKIAVPADGTIDFVTANAVDSDKEINIADVTKVAAIAKGEDFSELPALRSAATVSKDVLALNVVNEGSRQFVEVRLQNSRNYVGAQFDLTLPEGVVIIGENLGDRAAEHTLYSNVLSNGAHRVVLSTLALSKFADMEDNTIVRLEVIGDAKGMTVSNIRMSDESCNVHILRGINGDGTTTGINGVKTDNGIMSKIYSLSGQLRDTIKKGFNIIRNSDGTTTKVIIK